MTLTTRRTRRKRPPLPSLFLSLIFWSLWLYIFFFLPPESIRDFPIPGTYFFFFLTLFSSLFFTFSLIFAQARRGFFIASFAIIILILRLIQFGNLLNIFLLFSLFLVFEYYFSNFR